MSQRVFPSAVGRKKTETFIVLTLILLVIVTACSHTVPDERINPTGESIRERIKAPQGYQWVNEEKGSFGEYLQNLELEPAGTKILDYRNRPIANQSEHVAIISKDIGTKDLQQCADAVIRLRADYLWESNKADKVQFHFTNGDLYTWNDYKKGIRPVLVSSSKVSFEKKASYNDTHEGFRKYLEYIFTYAGTISLNNETKAVKENSKIKTGNIMVTPGSPGHALIIVGTAKNDKGEKVYLLAQGYTPAQSIHIITNPYNNALNPWYKLDVSKNPTTTARYTFRETNIRSFTD